MPLLYLSIAWVAGDLAGAALALPLWSLALPLPLFISAFFLRRHRTALILCGLCLLAFMGGAMRYLASIPPLDSTQIAFYNGKGNVEIEGTVSGPPEIQHASLAFRFSPHKITAGETSNAVKGDVLVRLPFYSKPGYGDTLRLTGRLETPAKFNDFDYRSYLENQGIYSVMNYPAETTLATGGGFPLMAWIYTLRDRLAEGLASCLPEPQGSLAQAVLLGLRGNLPEPLVQSFYATGTTHLIAISGLNLTIILGMVLTAAVWLFGRQNRLYIWLSLAFIWLYTLVTGLPATMVRSAIMGSSFLLAELLGRQRNGLAALSLASALMVAADPRVLWDASFQLSFLSMLGLILIAPLLIKMVGPAQAESGKAAATLKSLISISFGTTLAAVIATWPVTALDFHSFSLVTVPATFFAMPSFPPIMVTSLLTSIAGLLWHPLGVFFGWVAWVFLTYFILVVQLFAAIPSTYIQDINIQPWQAGLYYLLLASALLCARHSGPVLEFIKSLRSRLHDLWRSASGIRFTPYIYWVISCMAVANILVWTAVAWLPDGKLHVTVLDVGQGESILVRTPNGQNILIDSGPDPNAACSRLGGHLPFWDKNIDMLILTQLQSDHISGSLELMKKYHINMLATSCVSSNSGLPREIFSAADNMQTRQVTLEQGQLLNIGCGIRLDVLNPPPGLFAGTSDDANNNSLVLRLVCDNVSFLLTSDIGTEAERYLIENRADLQSDVLKVAHHGSKGSSSEEFLAIAHPAAAVISAGALNRFGHPNPEALERLADIVASDRVFVTSVSGDIEFITDGQKLWCKVERAVK